MHRGNIPSESIHEDCRQYHDQSLEANPQICVGLALPSNRNPQNHKRRIYTGSGRRASISWDLHSFSPRIIAILLQFIRRKSQPARGIWNLATVDQLAVLVSRSSLMWSRYGYIYIGWVNSPCLAEMKALLWK